MLSLILAAAGEVEACAKYGDTYVPPPAAIAAANACEEYDLEPSERFANGERVERDFEIAEYGRAALQRTSARARLQKRDAGSVAGAAQHFDGCTPPLQRPPPGTARATRRLVKRSTPPRTSMGAQEHIVERNVTILSPANCEVRKQIAVAVSPPGPDRIV